LAAHAAQRKQTPVPKDVQDLPNWQSALAMCAAHSRPVPHRWSTAADEFGRVAPFRAALRQRRENDVLEVPGHTLIRDLERRLPRAPSSIGRPRKIPWLNVAEGVSRQPAQHGQTLTVRDGTQGPLRVKALGRRVQTRLESHVGKAA